MDGFQCVQVAKNVLIMMVVTKVIIRGGERFNKA